MKSEKSILAEAAAAASGLADVSFEASDGHRSSEFPVDGMARIQIRGTVLKEPFIVRKTLRADFIDLLSFLGRDRPGGALLLVTGCVSDKIGEKLRSAGIHFIDTAGNVFLTGKNQYLFVVGRRAKNEDVNFWDKNQGRAFHPSGLKLIFNLLTDSELNAHKPGCALVEKPYREISQATGLPTSTVGWIMADLIHLKFIIQVSAGQRMLVDRVRLLDRWVQGYHERLRPSLLLGRYRPARSDWWQDAVLENGFWSGETAAARLTQSIKPQTTTIFGTLPSNEFILKHQLQKDPTGAVEVLKPFWAPSNPEGSKGGCVHPLLIYADLLSIDDDRTREVARIIYEHHIDPSIKTD